VLKDDGCRHMRRGMILEPASGCQVKGHARAASHHRTGSSEIFTADCL
jgi:hypothetical protein